MKIISHRGNLNGRELSNENTINAINNCISLGLDCEIDIWCMNSKIYLGHDSPETLIEDDFIDQYKENLWIHCKNIDAITWCETYKKNGLNYFWHESDTLTLTSNGRIWAYPGKQPIKNSIAVMPEIHNEVNLDQCYGICSDFPLYYKDKYENI